MCFYEGKEYHSDVARFINKYDIFICDLGEPIDANNSIGKNRPCVIVQSDTINEPKQATYIVAPIRTEHSMKVSKDTLQEIVDERRKVGRLYIPIEVDPDTYSFIDMTRLESVSSSNIKSYKNSIINPELKKKIAETLFEIFLSDEPYYNINPNNTVVNVSAKIKEEQKESKPIETIMPKPIQTTDIVLKSNNTDSEIGKKIQKAIDDSQNKTNAIKEIGQLYGKVKEGVLSTKEAAKEIGVSEDNMSVIILDYEKSLSSDVKKSHPVLNIDLKGTKSKYRIPDDFSMYYKAYKEKKMTVTQIAAKLGRHYQTVYEYIRHYEKIQSQIQISK